MRNAEPHEEGSEIFFRAVFGFGSAVLRRLSELREICDASDGQLWLSWVVQIGEELARYEPSRAEPTVWIGDVQNIFTLLANGPRGRDETGVAQWLKDVCTDLSSVGCADIGGQLEELNERAFKTACELFNDRRWSTQSVSDHWNSRTKLGIEYVFESGPLCMYPATDIRNGKIVVKLEKGTISKKFALLSYLTLHFQLVHEYISHVLPVFSSVSLEEEFLMVVLHDFYPQSGDQDGIESSLADILDRNRPDEHSGFRTTLRIVSSVVGREAFARMLLRISVTADEEISPAKKRRLLSHIGKFPALAVDRRPACQLIFDQADIHLVDLEILSRSLS
jgi:hypothetical protein